MKGSIKNLQKKVKTPDVENQGPADFSRGPGGGADGDTHDAVSKQPEDKSGLDATTSQSGGDGGTSESGGSESDPKGRPNANPVKQKRP